MKTLRGNLKEPSYSIFLLVCTLITVAIATGTVFSFNKLAANGDLGPPPAILEPNPENLGEVLATGQGAPPKMHRSIEIPYQERAAFKAHLQNAAMQEGWFVYQDEMRNSAIVLPAEELPELRDLQADPIVWVRTRTATGNTAKPPSSLNLVSVHLSIGHNNAFAFAAWFIATALGALASAITIPMLGYFYVAACRQESYAT